MVTEYFIDSIGITSTVPLEVPLAAGINVIDMNNRFITSPDPKKLVAQAEHAGLSFNLCGWVKGLYTMGSSGSYDRIVVVDSGDCADLVALADFWHDLGVNIIYFNYPTNRSFRSMRTALDDFRELFNVTEDAVIRTKRELDVIRRKLHELDRLTWQEGKVSGLENHLYLVQSSDFGSDPVLFDRALDNFLEEARSRPRNHSLPGEDAPRLGFVGVPPIITDFYQKMAELGGAVVYNETQHQFSMPKLTDDIVEQYLNYTYPYGGRARLEVIEEELERRDLDGIILYSENFCYKSIINTYLRKNLKIPSIEIEGKSPEPMDLRTRMRLEAFVEMLQQI